MHLRVDLKTNTLRSLIIKTKVDWEQIISVKPFNELSKLYIRAITNLADEKLSNRHQEVKWQIEIIKECWQNMDTQDNFIGRVETGLMAEMGYHVGDTKGVKQKYRRLIIEDVIKGPIPLVGNRRYMSWWGSDKSDRRLQAVKDFLRDKIYSPQHKNHQLIFRQLNRN